MKLRDSDVFASALTAFFSDAPIDALHSELIDDTHAIATVAGYEDATEQEPLDNAIAFIRDADEDSNTKLCSIITSVSAGTALLRQADAHSQLLAKSHAKLADWRALVQQAVKLIHDYDLKVGLAVTRSISRRRRVTVTLSQGWWT